jgi:ribosomal protein L37AE/L43A
MTRSCLLPRYLHGCNVLYELVRPWAYTNATVVADSYFASVQAAIRLKQIGLRFIGTVKTATKQFPMSYLGNYELQGGRGDRHGVFSRDRESGTNLMAFVWVDRERRYFIASTSSLSAGPPCIRKRWRQVDKTPNAPPELVDVVVAQPEACGVYYGSCSKIDQHNRLRQASLCLERKWRTPLWWRRVNMSIFAMCVVDAYLLAAGCQGSHAYSGCAKNFFAKLSEDLIENKLDQRNLRKRAERQQDVVAVAPDVPAHKQLIAPTPTKRFKKNNPTHRVQGRCMVCGKYSVHVCRECQLLYPKREDKQFWICDKPGKTCMGIHIKEKHPYKLVGAAVGETP